MSKVLIEEYRGWEISFDTEQETFYCLSDVYDRDEKKKSFASCKSFVDEYIKENNGFKEFFIESVPSFYRGYEKKKVIGIRKDGAFTIEEKGGKKGVLSKYNEKEYVVYNQDNKSIFDELKIIKDKINLLHEDQKIIEKKVTGKSLEEMRKLYQP